KKKITNIPSPVIDKNNELNNEFKISDLSSNLINIIETKLFDKLNEMQNQRLEIMENKLMTLINDRFDKFESKFDDKLNEIKNDKLNKIKNDKLDEIKNVNDRKINEFPIRYPLQQIQSRTKLIK